ncbi:hypothetical protein ABE607_00850 [Comamonas aquatica]|uniref:hypothetical protein n=1 Tax=Comamonas aquatica TaxID=225991 RepID=UPI00320BAA21
MSDDKKPKGKPRNVKNVIPIGDKEVSVYASPKVSKALEEITNDMSLYHGVRLAQVMEALYEQGKKDGARNAIGTIEQAIREAKDEVPHRNPGKPKKLK